MTQSATLDGGWPRLVAGDQVIDAGAQRPVGPGEVEQLSGVLGALAGDGHAAYPKAGPAWCRGWRGRGATLAHLGHSRERARTGLR